MSTPNTQSVAYDVMPEGYPQANEETTANETQQPTKKKKNLFARFVALIVLALCAVPVLLPIALVKGAGVESISLLDAVKELLDNAPNKLFGVLPTYADSSAYGKIVGTSLFASLLFLALSALISLFTIFFAKNAKKKLRLASFFLTIAIALQVVITFVTYYQTEKKLIIDIYPLAVMVGAGFIYFVLAVMKNGKTAWANTVTLLLNAVVTFSLIFAITKDMDAFKKGLESISLGGTYAMLMLALFGVYTFIAFVAFIRMQTKKGLGLDLIFYIVQFIVGVAVAYLFFAGKSKETLALVCAGVSAFVALVQMIICILRKKAIKKSATVEEESECAPCEQEQMQIEAVATQSVTVEEPKKDKKAEKKQAKQAKKEAKKLAKEEKKMAKKNKKAKNAKVIEVAPIVAPQPVEEFVREEYAEAVSYEGGPVEGVAVAEEVNPTFIPSNEPPQVQTAGYDFYNFKSFDPFIATLDNMQRNQFTEIFILKYSGTMPEIPDYTVGGDNREFFRKLFIYLGQYRDRIPDTLLAKIYQFAIKLN